MKKTIAGRTAAILLACLLTAGCQSPSRTVPGPVPADETEYNVRAEEEALPEKEEAAEKDALLVYQDVILQYQEAEEEDFYRTEEGYVEPDLSGPYVSDLMILQTQYHRSSEDRPAQDLVIGYSLADINRDGIPEMFVGAGTDTDQMVIYSVFTSDGTDPSPLMDVSCFGERTNLHVLEDGRMIERGSGGAALSVICLYSLPAGGLEARKDMTWVLEDGVPFTEDENNERTPVPQEEWDEAFRLYEEGPFLPLDWVPMALCRADT